MSRWIVAGLVLLNLVLGAGVYFRMMERPAVAQIGGARNSLSAVAGNQNNQSVLYVLEANSGRLIAIRSDPLNNTSEIAAARAIGQDLQGAR